MTTEYDVSSLLSLYEELAVERMEEAQRNVPGWRGKSANYYIKPIGVEITWSAERGYHYYRHTLEFSREQVVAMLGALL